MYNIEWTRSAVKSLRKIQYQDQIRIYQAVQILRKWPNCNNVKKIIGSSYCRLRIGKYRVIFNAENKAKIINIKEVKKRDERTY